MQHNLFMYFLFALSMRNGMMLDCWCIRDLTLYYNVADFTSRIFSPFFIYTLYTVLLFVGFYVHQHCKGYMGTFQPALLVEEDLRTGAPSCVLFQAWAGTRVEPPTFRKLSWIASSHERNQSPWRGIQTHCGQRKVILSQWL